MELAAAATAGVIGASYLDAKHHIGADLNKARALIDVRTSLAINAWRDEFSLWYVFERMAKKKAKLDCYVCEGQTLSWGEVNLQTRRVAHFLLSQGLQKGDRICIYMNNKPAYPIIWLACLSIDVVPAFINFNLEGKGLSHCISVINPSLVIFESDLASPISLIVPSIHATLPSTKFVRWIDRFSSEKLAGMDYEGLKGEIRCDEEVLTRMSTERIEDRYRKKITAQSPAVFIFTSGTTGLPKAAVCTHGRVGAATIIFPRVFYLSSSSRIYTVTPIYHSTAAFLSVAASWRIGSTVIIGRKFSATKFWEDCRKGNANVIQYVGEILRYVMAVPPNPNDKNHNVNLAYGNGLRPDVWNKFRDRFGVENVGEFYASSEGNGALFNMNFNTFGAGAVGEEGALARLSQRKKQVIVRVDALTEDPERDAKGWCIRAEPNEVGELIVLIVTDSAYQNFSGYHGNAAGTEKKIMRNVFEKGDAYFRTGDLLRRDKEGFTFFADRLGDTFRWRSENVSTQEVAGVLGEVLDEANVYGVLLPHHDGRAGCAAVPATNPLDLEKLAVHVNKALPKFARPLFIRVVKKMEQTGTGKQMKVELRKQGVDPAQVGGDILYWLTPNGKYAPFSMNEWNLLASGKVKL